MAPAPMPMPMMDPPQPQGNGVRWANAWEMGGTLDMDIFIYIYIHISLFSSGEYRLAASSSASLHHFRWSLRTET